MLVDEHPDGNTIHVEPIEEVLDVGFSVGINLVGILQFHHTLSHCHHYIGVSVPDLQQSVCEPVLLKYKVYTVLTRI